MSSTSPLPLAESTSHNIPSSYNNQITNQENESSMALESRRISENDENQPSKIKSSKTKLNVKIRAWNGVATWKWIANDDTCGICRVAFDGCCPGQIIISFKLEDYWAFTPINSKTLSKFVV